MTITPNSPIKCIPLIGMGPGHNDHDLSKGISAEFND